MIATKSIITSKIHLAVLLLSSAFQLIIKNPRKAPRPAINEVEAPTEALLSQREENRIPPIPPTTQMKNIFTYLMIDSNIVTKISAKIVLEKI